jgi:nucleotide-binding universal stress UspA family protein/hemerythrin-like domain-containing protein
MFKHALVPIDGSTLATELIRQAVLFARSVGAKLTFFHAQEDYGSSSVAALERVMWPTMYNEKLGGDARAVLAKAAVVAREAGVEHDTLTVTSDRPYEAILQAAENRRCDIIVIASHGKHGLRGLVLGSQTQNVLQRANLPVLVLSIESNLAEWERIAPLAIIRDEHRSLAAVAHGLEQLVREARESGSPPRFDLLRAIVYYIREFPEKLHHPKEDAYLFRRLRQRTSEYDSTLDELERQHITGKAVAHELESSLVAYEADPANGFERFARAAGAFVSMQEQHMRLEVRVVLPAAFKHLTPEDWDEIGRAFAENADPRFSAETDEEFKQLFVRILNLVPATSRAEPSNA